MKLGQVGLKTLWPAVVLVGGLLATTALVVARPSVEPIDVSRAHPAVRIQLAAPGPAPMRVRAQGTVRPRVETELVAEAAGRVVWVAPGLDAGSPFEAGDVLLRIEARDYEAAREQARAALERAESQSELAAENLERREALVAQGVTSHVVHSEAKNAARVAAANLREARARLGQAELDLERTELRAPFDGEVRERLVSVGQYVRPGFAAAHIFAVDVAEVRLALSTDALAFLDLPQHGEPGAPVRLEGRFAGSEVGWDGHLARFEGTLDPATRMVHVVAEIEDPTARERAGLPLPMGLFVDVEIEGRVLSDVVEVPRSALRRGNTLAIVDADSRLRLRDVEVVRADGERVWIRGQVAAGERICTTPPELLVEGMPVRVTALEGESALPPSPAARDAS
jgi:RND family efflux transporter MFP subunit